MLNIRPAQEKDSKKILEILQKLNLSLPFQSIANFWVAEKDGEIAGVAQLKEYDNFFFLRSFGVIEKYQHQGIATAFLKEIIKNRQKNIYLYTINSAFFEKFGFKTPSHPPSLLIKEYFSCEDCFPEKCACMVKFPDAP